MINWYKKAKAEVMTIDDLPIIEDGEDDDKELQKARKYFNIGHGDYSEELGYTPNFQLWMMIGGEIEKSKLFKIDPETGEAKDQQTHGSLWGSHNDNYRGRYEPQTGRLTVVKPSRAQFRDIPSEIMGKIQRAFPKSKKIITTNNKKEYKIAQTQRTFYRGTVPGETIRIDEPFESAKGLTFVARKPESAKMYGSKIETIIAKPETKILDSECPEFWKLINRKCPPNKYIGSVLRKNETTIDAVNDAITKAKQAGYDALSFEQDSDIGTILLNENAFIRTENELV